MARDFRLPLGLAVSLVLLLLIHLVVLAPDVKKELGLIVIPIEPGEMIKRLTVEAGGSKHVEILRRERMSGTEAAGAEVVHPFKAAGDTLMFEGVLRTLRGVRRDQSIPVEGLDLTDFGLSTPERIVTVETNRKTVVLRFGKQNPSQAGGLVHRYFQLDGDPKFVHQMFNPHYEDFEKAPKRWRSRQLVGLDAALVEWIRVTHKGVPYELAKTPERRDLWHLTRPYADRADWTVVNDLIAQIDLLRIQDRFPLTSEGLKKYGLDEPVYRVQIRRAGETRHITLAASPLPDEKPEQEGALPRKRIAAHLDGTDEIVICDGERLMKVFPEKAEEVRPRIFFPFPLEEIAEMEVFCTGIGRLHLTSAPQDLKKVRTRRPTRMRWTVESPRSEQLAPNHKFYELQQSAIELMVEEARRGTILRFGGRDAEPVPAKLDKPECRLTFKVRSGDKTIERVYYFESGSPATCHMKLGENRYELFDVDPQYVWKLKKMWLNFIVEVPFRCHPALIEALKVRRYDKAGNPVEDYTLSKDPEGRWSSDRKGEEKLAPENVLILIDRIAKLDPVDYFSQDPSDLTVYKLDMPEVELEWIWRDGARIRQESMRISRRQLQNLYFAKLGSKPVIFQIRTELPQILEKIHLLEFKGPIPGRVRRPIPPPKREKDK